MRSLLRFLFAIGALVFFAPACDRGSVTPAPPATAENPSAWQVVIEPDAGIAPVLNLVNSAQKTIRAQTHWLTDRELIDALKAARGRGVDVRVMYENQPLNNPPGLRSALNNLQAANISVRSANPAFKLAHAKFIVVDERVAVVMTFDQARVSAVEHRGYAIFDTHPDEVAEIIAVFEADWKRAPASPTNPNLAWSPFNARQRLYALIDDAKQSLDIECEELGDDELEARIANALKRGVAVRVVASPLPGSDALAAWQDKLTQAGAQLRLVKTPHIYGTLIIADNARAFVGSTRLVTRALDSYRDLGIVVNDAAARILSVTFAGDWNIGR